jgi:hypothetical protein
LGETLTPLSDSSFSGLNYTDQPTLTSGNVSNFNVTSGTMSETTADATLSALNNDLAATFGTAYPTIVSNLTNPVLSISATNASGFAVDQSLALGAGALTLNATGALSLYAPISAATIDLVSGGELHQNNAGTITAATLTGSAANGTFLKYNNQIANLGPFTSDGGLELTNGAPLTVTGALNVGTSYMILATTGAGSTLAVDAPLTGQAVQLNAGSTVTQNGAGIITATYLSGSSVGATTLTAANQIAQLQGFTTNNGAFSLNDGEAAAVNLALNAGTGDLTLTTGSDLALYAPISAATVDLVSGGELHQNNAGTITATTLTGSAANGTFLKYNNQIANLGAFTSDDGLELTDGAPLTVTGALNVGTSYMIVTTTGSNLAVDAPLTGAAVELNSSGTITQSNAGIITATYLSGSSVGATTLTANNAVVQLQSFTTGNGAFSFDDGEALTVTQAVNAGTGNLSLTTAAGDNLILYAPISGATVNLVSGGLLRQSSTGPITANLLDATAATGISLATLLNDIGSVGTNQTTTGPDVITP